MAQIFPVGPPVQIGVPDVLETDPYVPLNMSMIGSLLDRDSTRRERRKLFQAKFLKDFAAIGRSTKEGTLALRPFSKFHKKVFNDVNTQISTALDEAMNNMDQYDDPLAATKKLIEVGSILRNNIDYATSRGESNDFINFMKEVRANPEDYDMEGIKQIQEEFINSDAPFDTSKFSRGSYGNVDVMQRMEDLYAKDGPLSPVETVQRGVIPGTEGTDFEERGTVKRLTQQGTAEQGDAIRNAIKSDPTFSQYMDRRGITEGSEEMDKFVNQVISEQSMLNKPGTQFIYEKDPKTGDTKIIGLQKDTDYTNIKQTNAVKTNKSDSGNEGGGSSSPLFSTSPEYTPNFVTTTGFTSYEDQATQIASMSATYNSQIESFSNIDAEFQATGDRADKPWLDNAISTFQELGPEVVINNLKFKDKEGDLDPRAVETFVKEDLPGLVRAKTQIETHEANRREIDAQVIPKLKEELSRENTSLEELGLITTADGSLDVTKGIAIVDKFNEDFAQFTDELKNSSSYNKHIAAPNIPPLVKRQVRAMNRYKELRDEEVFNKYKDEARSVRYHPLNIGRTAKDTDFQTTLANGKSSQFGSGNMEFFDTNFDTKNGQLVNGEQFLRNDPVLDDIPNHDRLDKTWTGLKVDGIGYDDDLGMWLVVARPTMQIKDKDSREVIVKEIEPGDLAHREDNTIVRDQPILIPWNPYENEASRNFVGKNNLDRARLEGMVQVANKSGKPTDIPLPGRGKATVSKIDESKFSVSYTNVFDNLEVVTKMPKADVPGFLHTLAANRNTYIKPKSSYEALNFTSGTNISNMNPEPLSAMAHYNNYILSSYDQDSDIVDGEGAASSRNPGINGRGSMGFNISTVDEYGIGQDILKEIMLSSESTSPSTTLPELYKRIFGTPNVRVTHSGNTKEGYTDYMHVEVIR